MCLCADDAVLTVLKSMPSSTIEFELSLLSSAAGSADDDDQLLVDFIHFLAFLFSTKRDVDLASSYLGLILKVTSVIWSR